MGEYVGLAIGNHDYISYKNSFGDLLLIFSEDDLKIEEAMYEDGEIYTRRYFTTTVSRAKKCLDALGYTISTAKSEFENCKKLELEYLEYCAEDDAEYEGKYKEIKENFTFDEWARAVKKLVQILANDSYDSKINGFKNLEAERNKVLTISEKIVIDTLPYSWDGKFYGLDVDEISVWNIFRVILEAFSSEEIIVLDYTNLYEGGWCNEVPEEQDYAVSKTIVLTEGKFDVEVLTESMRLLYPYMCKFYSFMNFSDYKVQGSTSFLTHYLKAFIAAGVQNRVIAIYDNDAAGQAEMIGLSQIKIPENFRVLCLPEIELANNYPTLGPNGRDNMDINGKACSIELYLGKDVLTENNEFIPVHWKGYNEKTGTYQGEIMHKSLVQDKFREKMDRGLSGNSDINYWNEMIVLLETIFSAFLEKEDRI